MKWNRSKRCPSRESMGKTPAIDRQVATATEDVTTDGSAESAHAWAFGSVWLLKYRQCVQLRSSALSWPLAQTSGLYVGAAPDLSARVLFATSSTTSTARVLRTYLRNKRTRIAPNPARMRRQ